ncbi:hypothetical protein M0R45_018444 [Rubus argutus]|uniref:DUF4283 domain-containing protein n=1 Tax=Rubus argutus TaxID=59490 RepID=A0AAW1X519_RUBAR
MASIEAVTASFAASMALAEGRKPVDIGRLAGGSAKQTSQAFLLGRVFTHKAVEIQALRSHFRRIWVLEKPFRIQEKPEGRFLFSFDDKGDKRRVLRGGPWSFAKAHLALEDYDGINPLLKVPLNSVCFWVKIGNIPPAFEEPDTIALIASTVSSFLELDHKLFRIGEIRVRVRHDVTKPVLLSEVVRLAAGVEVEVSFFYENLVGRCSACGLIYHVGVVCALPATVISKNQSSYGSNATSFEFGSSTVKLGTTSFTFSSQIARNLSRPLFANLQQVTVPSKDKRAVVIRSLPDSFILAMEVSSLTAPMLGKRGRLEVVSSSPKMLKLAMTCDKFSARSLGLAESDTWIIVQAEPLKKKRGRPLGAKNKAPKAKVQKELVGPLRLTYPTKSPRPISIGKEKRVL